MLIFIFLISCKVCKGQDLFLFNVAKKVLTILPISFKQMLTFKPLNFFRYSKIGCCKSIILLVAFQQFC
jgi:hypothetical protein